MKKSTISANLRVETVVISETANILCENRILCIEFLKMDTSSLIDLKSPTSKAANPNKIASPLIPLPNFEQSNTKYFPRLSDVDNNPFDKVLRNVTNKDDPFERAYESAYVVNKFGTEIATIMEEKENISHLISPLQTPVKNKRSKKIAAGPLYIDETVFSKSFKECDVTKTPLPKSILDLQSTNQDLSATDFSLQCLSESMLDKFDLEFGESFSVALNMPLPESPEEVLDSAPDKYSVSIMNDETSTIPSVLVANENSYADTQSNSAISVLNNAFVDNTNTSNNRTTLLSTKSSVSSKNRYSFHSDSLGNDDISNIYPSLSSTKEVSSQYTLDKAFLKNSIDLSENNSDVQLNCQRKCMSARKPTKYELSLKYLASMPDTPKRQNLNNSFAGFNFTNRANDNQKQSTGFADDSVFLEATNLAHAFSRLANGSDNNLEDENLYELSPPWLQENIDFCDNEDAKNEKESLKISEQSAETITNTNENLSTSICLESNANDTSDMRNAKDLLQNLTEILKCDGNVVDQRKLGENLLNSLALALNLEKPNLSVQYPVEQEQEATELKVPSAEKVKRTDVSPKQCESNPVVPKIKTQSVRVSLAPTKFEKTLKVKTEKEKVTAKGPLKAIIPVTNMAKNKRSVAPKVVLGNITPPKCLQVPSAFQVKKTSTPYELKLKAPIAQSTPDSCKPNNEGDKGTPVCKRQFKYSLSPLTRPASTGDISCNEVNSNKPVSPTNTSGSVPIINKQLSPKDTPVSKLKPMSPRGGSSGNVSCPNKLISSIGKPAIPTVNGLIPMSRRKSSSDIKSNNNVLNRSYDSQKKPARPMLLKRSSSFQSKASTSAVTAPQSANSKVENNTNKKYGAPGSRLKSLSLLKK